MVSNPNLKVFSKHGQMLQKFLNYGKSKTGKAWNLLWGLGHGLQTEDLLL